MKYYKIDDFIKKIKKGKSTLYNFYRNNNNLFLETTLSKNRRKIPETHIKYFNSDVMFEENKSLAEDNRYMKNLIYCLGNKDCLESRLWGLNWSFFSTVSYKTVRNKVSCFKKMTDMYNTLLQKYGHKTTIRLFFTAEEFTNRDGYHNHFILHIKDERLHSSVIEDLRKFFSYDRFDVQKYNKFKAGLFYISKEGLKDESWDLLGNNLITEGAS